MFSMVDILKLEQNSRHLTGHILNKKAWIIFLDNAFEIHFHDMLLSSNIYWIVFYWK